MRPFLCSIGFAVCLVAGACTATDAPDGTNDDLASLHASVQRELGGERELLENLRYAAALVDLDGDGLDEAVVYAQERGFCGTSGCGITVLVRSGGSWRTIAETRIGWPPVRVLETRSHGWRDLGVIAAGGGIIPGYEALLAFDGTTYPSNPTVPPARPLRAGVPGRVLIPGEPQWRPLLD